MLVNNMKRFSVVFAVGCVSAISASSSLTPPSSRLSATQCDEKKQEHAMSPKEFRSFPITEIVNLSPNTRQFRVKLPSKDSTTGMKTSGFVMIKNAADSEGKFEARPYTPTSLGDQKGSVEFVVKAYPNGKVTGHLFDLKVGDSMDIKGPIPKFKYEPNMKSHIGMIAGGTGITPMLQIIQEIIRNPDDNTQISLIFANNTEEDILLKDRLDMLARHHKNFKVTYVVAQPSPSWQGEKGFCSETLIQLKLPAPAASTLIFVCGPPGMMNAVSGPKTPDYQQGKVDGLLKKVGYGEEHVFKF